MPQLPSLDAPRPVAQGRRPIVGVDATQVAEANLRLGQTIGGAITGLAEQKMQEIDTASLMEAEQQLSEWKMNTMFNPEQGVYTRKGKNALDVTKQTLPAFEKRAEELGKNLTTPAARERWATIIASQRQSLNSELTRYEFGERESHFDAVEEGQLATAVQGASNYFNDPKQIAYYQNKMNAVLGARGRRKGLPAELVNQQILTANSQMAVSVIQRMAADDPYKAQQYYATTAPSMTAEDQDKITKLLGGSVRKRMADDIASGLWDSGSSGASGLTAAVIQAESGGDPTAISPKGARGLMQLMPATAKETAAKLGLPYDEARLTSDPNYNMALGKAYLNELLARYDGDETLAVAAYNAGPGSVDDWLKRNGDPRTGEVSTADWIARIPFEETRDYTSKIMGAAEKRPPASVQYAEALKVVNKIEDSELRELTLDRLDDFKKEQTAAQNAVYDQAAQVVNTQGFNQLAPEVIDQLQPDDLGKLRKLDRQRREGVEPVTDTNKLEKFLNLPTRQLAELSLARDIRPYLNNSDFSRVTTAWEAAKKGDGSTQASQAAEFKAVQSVMNLAGIQFGTSKDAQSVQNMQMRSQFENSYNQLRDAFVQKNGVDPTAAEAQKIAEQLLVEVRMSKTGLFSNDLIPAWKVKPDERQNIYIDPDDIDLDELTPNERQQALDQLRAGGVQQVSRETMTEAYLQVLKARGLEVRR